MRYYQKYGYIYWGIGLIWLFSAFALLGLVDGRPLYLIPVYLSWIVAILNFLIAVSILAKINYISLSVDLIIEKQMFFKKKVIIIQDIESLSIEKRYLSNVLKITTKTNVRYIYNKWKISVHDLEDKILKLIKNDTVK